MFGKEDPFTVTGNTISLTDDNKSLLLVTPARYDNILVSRYGVELTDLEPVRRANVKNVVLSELFKRDKTFFFIRAGGVEYQIDLKYVASPISEVKF
ncbi:hypothetical protein CWE12_13275 [Aliidiomarina sedimenti]|uniref:Uncharacterized protein n=2 Tax=Aliidiomarina TaxID=1249554 RepID=A0A432WDX7_9GAMM|nr:MULTISPECIES: hypothetical protein [Aliidiomarina]RUO27901.1 hypothetical protein CWE12_13275 [Aliidiomarina sedimenti]RUO31055.1 hypothetical protein CWE14_11155 [Aliidiomarina soli]